MAGTAAADAASDGGDRPWRSLAELSTVLAEATQDLGAVLDLVARRAVELVGDGCVVLLASDDDVRLVPAAVHHEETDGAAFLRELFASTPVQLSDEDFFGQVFRTGTPLLIPHLTAG